MPSVLDVNIYIRVTRMEGHAWDEDQAIRDSEAFSRQQGLPRTCLGSDAAHRIHASKSGKSKCMQASVTVTVSELGPVLCRSSNME